MLVGIHHNCYLLTPLGNRNCRPLFSASCFGVLSQRCYTEKLEDGPKEFNNFIQLLRQCELINNCKLQQERLIMILYWYWKSIMLKSWFFRQKWNLFISFKEGVLWKILFPSPWEKLNASKNNYETFSIPFFTHDIVFIGRPHHWYYALGFQSLRYSEYNTNSKVALNDSPIDWLSAITATDVNHHDIVSLLGIAGRRNSPNPRNACLKVA